MINKLYNTIFYGLLLTNAIPFAITNKNKKMMNQLLKEKKHPWQIIKRIEAVRLLSNGLSQTLVAKQLCVRREIIYEYRRAFLAGGIPALLKMDKPGKETTLTEDMLSSLEVFRDSRKRRLSNRELCEWLYKQYRVTISQEWIAKRLAMRGEAREDESWK